MKTNVASTRLDPKDLQALEELSKLEGLDRAVLLRQLLHLGLQSYRANAAVMAYSKEQVSLSRAAEIAGLSQWEMLGLLEKHRVSLSVDSSDLDVPAELTGLKKSA